MVVNVKTHPVKEQDDVDRLHIEFRNPLTRYLATDSEG